MNVLIKPHFALNAIADITLKKIRVLRCAEMDILFLAHHVYNARKLLIANFVLHLIN